MFFTYEVETAERNEFVNIDHLALEVLEKSGITEGIITAFTPHTTAGVTINENADPDVTRDLVYGMGETFDNKKEYRHAEGNSDSHMKSSLTGASETLIVHGREIVYGTWQSLYFAEFDGPRTRKVYFKVLEG
ncbi:secondary thiamine-phosphate synthase enzyme YjbQ [Salinicoccus halitifaciens]|uniref:Secondary thiamine-phosphate synthase enzyme n=1 Tax=Salinicoccus halitifaciens TaxID=1073415 RepID=A0ABV2EBT2_9STAP|nr:secondary thiamine-phosphate synthase enzyme YjbQ [Salinicoccus halitifaciens]MCD2137463.1 secondary thiamine-phosphate synthase enzyme YjbQ [Salinicoccus halitifaciens]